MVRNGSADGMNKRNSRLMKLDATDRVQENNENGQTEEMKNSSSELKKIVVKSS